MTGKPANFKYISPNHSQLIIF